MIGRTTVKVDFDANQIGGAIKMLGDIMAVVFRLMSDKAGGAVGDEFTVDEQAVAGVREEVKPNGLAVFAFWKV